MLAAARSPNNPVFQDLSYGTVRDFCDSADKISDLAARNGDLKDLQRPWAVKALVARLPRGARLLEIGGGEPLAAAALVKLGYQVTLCDPFEGQGNGPIDFEAFRKQYPEVTLVRALFTADWAREHREEFDAVFSISVLEHIHSPAREDVFAGIGIVLRPGGLSLHAIDHVLDGEGRADHEERLARTLESQARVAEWAGTESTAERLKATIRPLMGRKRHWADRAVERLAATIRADLESFFLSAHGFNAWRGQTPYAQYPFRKVCSIQTIVRKPVAG